MNKILSNYDEILKQIRLCEKNLDGKYCETKLIAVSKQFPKETIQILVNKGHKFGYQNFSSSQIFSLINLCKILKKKFAIKNSNFLGHSDIAPLRKLDPGEKFPWKRLNKHKLGRWYKEQKNWRSDNKYKKKEILFFKNLHKLGYRYFNIFKRSKRDKKIIIAFQQHFLPNNVSGIIDQKSLKISHFLLEKALNS